MTVEPSAAAIPVGELGYEPAVRELERIVSDLDQGIVDVDALGERFQRAIDIVEELDERISRTRQKVEELAPRLEAIGAPKAPREEGF